jgi:uncharacterized protein (TIGR02266 family)
VERRKILVAAQRDILEATKHSFFQRVHYDLLVVYNGEEAFAAIEAQDPVLVILSLDMPEFPGDACCRRVKNDRLLQKTPIILVAPPVSDESQERCHQSGCDAVVLTPLEPQELVTTACRFLGIGKRIEHRTPVDLATHYGPLSGDTFPGRVVDLTSGGVFISATKLLPIDTRITVEFALPGESEETRYLGRVSWVNHPEWMKTSRRHFGMGVQFLDLPPERRTAILQYLAELDRNKVETLASGDEG